MSENKTEGVQERLDLVELMANFFRVFRKTWILVVILAAGLGALQYYRTYRAFQPRYTASATLSVSSGLNSTTDIVDNAKYYDSQAASQVLSSFGYIVNSEAMQERIRLDLDVGYVNGYIYSSSVGDTNIFNIFVTSGDPKAAYDILNSVIKNYPSMASFVIGNTRLDVIQEPVLPETPSNAFNGRNAAIKGAFYGGVLGIGLTLLLALGRKTVRTSADLKGSVSLRCFVSVPKAGSKRRRKNSGFGISLLNPSVSPYLSGAFGALRVKVMRGAKADAGNQMILVTSTVPGEGKTTVSYNLAVSIAQSGHSVILVDADLRNPSVKERFGVSEKSVGLLELAKTANPDVEAALQPVQNLPKLWLLAGDTGISSPMALLDSQKMGRILRQLHSMAEYVILDAPPTGILADAAVLARHADQVLYVVRYDSAPRRQIVDGMQGLARRNVPVMGYVINGCPNSGSGRYGYGYGYGYSYGYGKKYGYGKRKESRRGEE